MLSVITCSRNERLRQYHLGNIRKTIGTSYEHICIDNSVNSYGLCSAYNEGVSRAQGDICVFVHEDVFFLESGWGQVLRQKFETPSIGLVGVAGTQYLFADDLRWHGAGQPFTKGRVIHELKGGREFILTVFNWDRSDADAVVVDGLFFAVRKELFRTIRFDEKTFPGFHFYDLDICMQVRQMSRCIVTWDILVKHLSAGKNDSGWFSAAEAFGKKYRDSLPAHCAKNTPDRSCIRPALNYDIRGKVPQCTVV